MESVGLQSKVAEGLGVWLLGFYAPQEVGRFRLYLATCAIGTRKPCQTEERERQRERERERGTSPSLVLSVARKLFLSELRAALPNPPGKAPLPSQKAGFRTQGIKASVLLTRNEHGTACSCPLELSVATALLRREHLDGAQPPGLSQVPFFASASMRESLASMDSAAAHVWKTRTVTAALPCPNQRVRSLDLLKR